MDSLSHFTRFVDGIYGIYLDSVFGFVLNKREIESGQQYTISTTLNKNPKIANLDYLDALPIVFSKTDPTDSNTEIQHRCTQKQFKERNGKGGLNHKIISQMCIVVLYQYWEIIFRPQIAKELGIKTEDLKDHVMGDLKIFRHSIIHHTGVALPDIHKCKEFKWFSEGDEIFIDDEKMEEMIRKIKEMIKHLSIPNQNK